MRSDGQVIITTTCRDEDEAGRIARRLVEAKLAACVQSTPVTSVYVWNGQLTEDTEITLSIKTMQRHVAAIEDLIMAAHSYDLPEFVVVPVADGSVEYLNWIEQETDSGSAQSDASASD